MNFFKQVKHLPFPLMNAIPGKQSSSFFTKHPFLGELYKNFLKSVAFQRIVFADETEYFNYYSGQTDYVIVGENPLITAILIKKIYDLALQYNQKINVLVVTFSDNDYWGYHYLDKTEHLNDLGKKLNIPFHDIASFYQHYLPHNINDHLNINILKSSEDINHFKYDKNSNKWLIFFENKGFKDNYFKTIKPTIMNIENKIKEDYWSLFFKHISDTNIKINFLHPNEKEKVFYLFANKIFLSSFPTGWMTVNYAEEEDRSIFQHELIHVSFGSAVSVQASFDNFEEQSIEDLIICSKYILK